MDTIVKKYCWIKNNAMYMDSDTPPNSEWCERYIEVNVDISRKFIYEHNTETDTINIIYID